MLAQHTPFTAFLYILYGIFIPIVRNCCMASDARNVYVAIDGHPKAPVLLRAAANKARELGCNWTAIYVETPVHERLSHDAKTRILRHLTMAEEMGALTLRLEGKDAATTLAKAVDEARDHGVVIQSFIIGKTHKEGLWSAIRSSTHEKLTSKLRNSQTAVQLIPLSGNHYKSSWFDQFLFRTQYIQTMLVSAGLMVAAYAATEVTRTLYANAVGLSPLHIFSLYFLAVCSFSSVKYGLFSSLFGFITGALIAYFAYVLTNAIPKLSAEYELAWYSMFAIAGFFITLIGSYTHASVASAERKEKRARALHALYRAVNDAQDRDTALQALHKNLSELLDMEVAFFLPDTLNPETLQLAYPKTVTLTESDWHALEACWENTRTAGLGAVLVPLSSWRFEPLVTAHGDIGVMSFKLPLRMRLDASFGRLLSAVADQAASVLERIETTEMLGETRVSEEREKLRSMLLSSVSHDLKTPLASIIGSLSVYKRMRNAGRLTDETALELTETALDEAQRLDGFISNILNMTRIENGDIRFRYEWLTPEQLVYAVQKRLKLRLREHQLQIEAHSDQYDIYCDRMMSEQVLQNMIDNAAKYAPKNTAITVRLESHAHAFEISVRDQGDGVPEEKFATIFNKYERLKQSDSQVAGTGLGLAICQAIMAKQGGKIRVENHPEGGAIFTATFSKQRMKSQEGAV
jgi:two-component system sensor histidine kinase KdpD